MEIKIDTNKDSKEHIQHMIEFLQRFVGQQGAYASSGGVFSDTSAEAPAEGIFGMFGDDAPVQQPDASGVSEDPEPEQKLSLEPY